MTAPLQNGIYPFALPSTVMNEIICNRFEFLLISELSLNVEDCHMDFVPCCNSDWAYSTVSALSFMPEV